jgi:pyrroline-5-carboxylate reductase
LKISFVGGGVMAEAIIGGILEAHLVEARDVKVGEPMGDRREYLQGKYGLRAYPENVEALEGADIVVIAVKPQSLAEAMSALRGGLGKGTAVASIVAGARMATLTEGLQHPPVIRVMPNTPAQIGAGMSVWTAAPEVSEERTAATRDILRTLGEEIYVPDEKLIDMATALSASGPAYVFLFIEALIDAGVYLGMTRDVARTLALQTVLGSTRLVEQTGRHPAELKDMVTSPAGATVEGILAFEQRAFRGAVMDAVSAAYDKSMALGEQK